MILSFCFVSMASLLDNPSCDYTVTCYLLHSYMNRDYLSMLTEVASYLHVSVTLAFLGWYQSYPLSEGITCCYVQFCTPCDSLVSRFVELFVVFLRQAETPQQLVGVPVGGGHVRAEWAGRCGGLCTKGKPAARHVPGPSGLFGEAGTEPSLVWSLAGHCCTSGCFTFRRILNPKREKGRAWLDTLRSISKGQSALYKAVKQLRSWKE